MPDEEESEAGGSRMLKIVELKEGGMREFYRRFTEFFYDVIVCADEKHNKEGIDIEEAITKCIDEWMEKRGLEVRRND